MIGQNYYIYLFPIFFIIVISYWLRAFRWKLLLIPIKETKIENLFSITMIGFMMNNIFPLRMGEFYRAYALGKEEKLSNSTSFATIILERIFDIFTLLLFLFFVSKSFDLPGWINNSTNLIFLLSFTLFILLVVITIFPQGSINILEHFLSFLSTKYAYKMKSIFTSFIDGLKILRYRGHLFIIIILSILIWLLMAFINQLVFYSFSTELPYIASFTLLVVTGIGVMIPSAPGYIGTFQLFSVLALGLFSISKVEALSMSIFLHFSEYLIVTTLGLIYLGKKIYPLKD